MLDAAFYDLTQNAQGAVFQAAVTTWRREMHTAAHDGLTETPPLLQLRAGLAESPAWFMVQAAEFDPEPLTVQGLRVRAVWSSERIVQAILELLAGERWLDRVGEAYYVTERGRAVLQRMMKRRIEPFVGFEPIPLSDISRLESLMSQVIDASLNSADPPGTWCLRHSRRRAPDDGAPVLAKIIQYCSDLNAFRDDAHMAAFAPHRMAAYMWEAFTFVYHGRAESAGELFDQLAYRGYSAHDFADALRELERRGWLKAHGDQYRVTATGAAVREEAERLTDQYFFAPWSCLRDSEITVLHDLLTRLVNESRKIAQQR